MILVILGSFRELFGAGTLWGLQVIPQSWYIENGGFYSNNGLVLPPRLAPVKAPSS